MDPIPTPRSTDLWCRPNKEASQSSQVLFFKQANKGVVEIYNKTSVPRTV